MGGGRAEGRGRQREQRRAKGWGEKGSCLN